jgi:TolB-like protein
MMGNDEQNAFRLLRKSRQIQQPAIENHGGKWIKELGDGVLASFDTATDAVHSAMHIIDMCSSVPELNLRIGIHLGDVVFENNDVFGDGVNIASRLLQQAKPGSIFISGPVYDNVANKKGISCSFIGEELLKNVREPVRLYEVKPNNHFTYTHNQPVQAVVQKLPEKSIAVLPFFNMSNDTEQEYFSDGITEEILNALAQVKDLHVAGRTSSFHFKNKNYDLRKIGQKLNVQTVLEGSVRRNGGKLRITAQLINVEDGFHIWSEKYDRDLDDIFAIQDEIALAITEKLKVTLLEKEKNQIKNNPTTSQEAYDLFLKGRFYFNKRGKNIIKAIEYFHLALAKDADFSLAYTGLADAYCILSLYGIVPAHDAMPKAKEYASRAMALNPGAPEPMTAGAFINTFYDWDCSKARQIFQEVLQAHPSYAPAHYWYSYFLSFVERNDGEAIKQAKMAAEVLEPLVPIAHHILSIMYFNAGQFEQGVAASRLAIELDESSYPAYRGLGLNLGGLKKLDEAEEAFKKAITCSDNQPLPMAELCWIYYMADNKTEIEKIFSLLKTRSSSEYVSSFLLGCLAWFLGNKDEAEHYLEQAVNNKDTLLMVSNSYQPTDFIREDPRLSIQFKRIGFPPHKI